MRNKNGFIATSVLYAFLVAFLTLFLGFMANYIQNKQLINRIESMAREDLDKYGNIRISNMKIGDYVIFDTIDNVGNGITNDVIFSSPIDPNTKWILYKIDETSDENNKFYYFISASDAQKGVPLGTALYDFENATEPVSYESLTSGIYASDLATVSKIINGNIYYNPTSQSYRSFDSSVKDISVEGFTKVYSYQFMYFLGGGIDVRLLNNADFLTLNNIENSKIKDAIFDQRGAYTFWKSKNEAYGETATELTKEGFYTLNYRVLTESDNQNEDLVSRFCSSKVGYQHEVERSGYEHYYEYCYYVGTYIGTCTDSSNPNCGGGATHNPRFVATVKVAKNNSASDGYADSGNGTVNLPYLITKGTKK